MCLCSETEKERQHSAQQLCDMEQVTDRFKFSLLYNETNKNTILKGLGHNVFVGLTLNDLSVALRLFLRFPPQNVLRD